jgi:peptidoglycan-associated lipoprotein
MSPLRFSAFSSGLVAVAALTLSACAGHAPPPAAPAPPAAKPAPAPPAPPPPPAAAPVPAAPAGPAPGSRDDFVVNVGDRVYFDFDQYALTDAGRALLARQAAWLKSYGQVAVRIEGNCDERGTREYNLALGARRAQSVKAFLVAQGVAASRIATISYGKEHPVDTGQTEEAWSHNRNAHTSIVSGAN